METLGWPLCLPPVGKYQGLTQALVAKVGGPYGKSSACGTEVTVLEDLGLTGPFLYTSDLLFSDCLWPQCYVFV